MTDDVSTGGKIISIHALLAESDCQWRRSVKLFRHFYPRSPCGERHMCPIISTTTRIISIHALLAESDVSFMLYDTSSLIFLSTLSLRRATCVESFYTTPGFYFYPRSPCGERQRMHQLSPKAENISIHALLAESDVLLPVSILIHAHFYPRSPCGERRKRFPPMCTIRHFYPRSPCGERHNLTQGVFNLFAFLSTLSLRRATYCAV